jgi:hypothetical protein
VWEENLFIGCVLFSYGATPTLAKHHGMRQTELCELTRIALRDHHTPVSRIVAISLHMLHRQSPGIRLVVSFADMDRSHYGGIYQAGNWIYLGPSNQGRSQGFRIGNHFYHRRSIGAAGYRQSLPWLRAHVDPLASEVITRGKHKYAYPFDDAIRKQLQVSAKPYPKRERSAENGTASPLAGGGVNPTRSLHVEGGDAA